MRIKNLTPHALNLLDDNQEPVLTVEPSGIVARVASVETPHDDLVVAGGHVVSLASRAFGHIEGLPGPEDGVLYFVSAITASAAWEQGRRDVIAGLTSVRDEQGRIIGAQGFAVHPDGIAT
jgi:hypothetical protein